MGKTLVCSASYWSMCGNYNRYNICTMLIMNMLSSLYTRNLLTANSVDQH